MRVKNHFNKLSKAGFSMIELVTVLGILITVTYFALPALEVVQVRSREKLLWQRLFAIRRAIDKYAANQIGQTDLYPKTIRTLVDTGSASAPLLLYGSLGNPFSISDDEFLWDIRIASVSASTPESETWHKSQDNIDKIFDEGIYDIRYPEDGVKGWKKALDGTNYDQW